MINKLKSINAIYIKSLIIIVAIVFSIIQKTTLPIFSVVISLYPIKNIDENLTKLILISILFRLIIIIFVGYIVPIEKLIDLYPDQKFYLESASNVAQMIKSNGIIFDYIETVGLHNISYSVLAAYLSIIFKNSNLILVYRFLNFILHSLLIIFAANKNRLINKRLRYIYVGLVSYLPIFLIFNFVFIREIFLMLLFYLLYVYRNEKEFLKFFVVLIIAYFTRRQIIYVVFFTETIVMSIKTTINVKLETRNKIILFTVSIVFLVIMLSLMPRINFILKKISIVDIFKYLKEVILGFLSIKFLFSNISNKFFIFISKLLTIEVFVVPISYIKTLLNKVKMRKFNYIDTYFLVFIFLYTYGYFVVNNDISSRYFLVFYPILLDFIFNAKSQNVLNLTE